MTGVHKVEHQSRVYRRNCEIKSGMDFPVGMQRWALGVEYQGATFNGFQRQSSTPNTVQHHLEDALSRIAAEEIALVCAGRTDAGVHASEQVIHFDTLARRDPKAWIQGGNTQLPDDIRIHWAKTVPPEFHARFSALSRTYRFVFHCAETRPACLHKSITWTSYRLDLDSMNTAAGHLAGEHNFSSFRSSQCQAHSPIRRVDFCYLRRKGSFIVMEIRANAFLHHMVRNIAGVLLDIGRGAKPPSWMAELLAMKDRTRASPTARPWGLYLVNIAYPERFALPQRPLGPLFLTGL